MGDRKRRWICRLIFVCACAVPTIFILSLLPTQPNIESVSEKFSHLLGLPVSISEIQTPTPFKTILKNVRIHDPEHGTLLLLDKIELTQSLGWSNINNPRPDKKNSTGSLESAFSAWDRWSINSAQITEEGLPFLSTRFHETLLRLRRRTGFPIDIGSLQVIQKSPLDSKKWESLIQKDSRMPGQTVLRLKNVKFDRVTSSQIAVAAKKSRQSRSSESQKRNPEVDTALNWRSGWNLSARIADPTLISWKHNEPTVPLNIEFHRIKKQHHTNAARNQNHYLTYWAAKIGQTQLADNSSVRMAPWSWINTKSLKKRLNFHQSSGSVTPILAGELSGIIQNNRWKLFVDDLLIERIQLGDLDRLICGKWPGGISSRIAGLCKLRIANTTIENGRVKKSTFGVESLNGQVSRELALQINAHRSIKMFLDSSLVDPVDFENLRLRVDTYGDHVQFQPWFDKTEDKKFVAMDRQGNELLRFEANRTFPLSTVVEQMTGKAQNASVGSTQPLAVAFLSNKKDIETQQIPGRSASGNSDVKPVQFQSDN